MRKLKINHLSLVALTMLTAPTISLAQFSLSAQLRTRTELRDGLGTPLPENAKAAVFTSQRTRLAFGYSGYRLKFGASLQDVRVWGEDVSTLNRNTVADHNNLMLHEAWGEILLNDTAAATKISFKIGRQEIIYDDSRLIGNLDWLQQARRHDAAILKFENKAFLVHTGFAYNQNGEKLSNTTYNNTTPGYPASTNAGQMYKSFEYLYAAKKLKGGTVSYLMFLDQFNKYHLDAGGTKVVDTGSLTRGTTGVYYLQTLNKVTLNASAFYQFGKNATGTKVSAYLLSANAMFATSKKFSAGLGIDLYSGGTNGTTNNVFDPLYGTPHKFAGYMDYYYVASGFGKSGLTDAYLKAKYKASDKWLLAADLHQFFAATEIKYTAGSKLKSNLGSELDLTANFQLTKEIGFEGGYAHYFTTSTLTAPSVKNVANPKGGANWAYLMIILKPQLFSK